MIESSYLITQSTSFSEKQLKAYLSGGQKLHKKNMDEMKQRFLANHKREREQDKIEHLFGHNDLTLTFIHSQNMRLAFEYHDYSHKCILLTQSTNNAPTQTDMFSENGITTLANESMFHEKQDNVLNSIIPSQPIKPDAVETRMLISLYPEIKASCHILQFVKETLAEDFAFEISNTLQIYKSQLLNLDKYPANKARHAADTNLRIPKK